MLDFDQVTKRFGPMTALDRCTFSARPARLTGFLGPNGPARRPPCGRCSGWSSWRRGRSGGTVRRSAPRTGPGSATCRRSGACTRGCGCGTSWSTSASCCGREPEAVSRSVGTWLERLGLADRAADRLDALSHGNQQRVQLIAALVNDPDLLVLDEPFSGPDPIAMGAMGKLLAGLAAEGAAVLFSSHQLDLVQDLCQDVVIIEHGRIVLAGELAELRAKVPQRFIDIRYQGPAPDWSRLAPATVIEAGEGQARLRVGRDTDVAAVLAAVRDRASLVSFSYQPPTLSELFRQAVAA